ncbi:Ribonuclease BN, tRNA processing enzyme [Stigmatella aurantiaca]|uniref:Ribonuclease BN, tRNA processing enzyme n=1 Tax=Stigmatella aurantiaca TaxID=41 RepID=A0A1H7S644_STIAU|nr:MBL fold metallo-hydrolase [Stigmatella aurantiaca]SEL67749.1 Ribonuclease BN, tRNA processing enzyme [Stigmatella aurantiaca]
MSLSFLTLGVGDAFSALRYSSCLAVEAEGQVLLIDCPHPIRKMMREASESSGVSLDADRVAGVALTHLHADHSSGLEGLSYFSFFLLKRKLSLLCHPEVAQRLWEGHLAAGMECLIEKHGEAPHPKHFDDYFAHTPLSTESAVRFGPFSIECRFTYHHLPTTALRIRAGGRCLGYSADTSFDEGLIAWLAEADLLVHETNYGVHTPYAKLAALPAELRARMRLIHYPDDFDTEGSVIEPLAQGRRYTV